MKQGDTFIIKRVFSVSDVERFVEISGDKNTHHVVADDQGRLVVHGLLTATLPTIIGGRFNIIARHFQCEFLKPVYTGDEISCTVCIEKFEEQPNRTKVTMGLAATNQSGTQVMTGSIFGLLYV